MKKGWTGEAVGVVSEVPARPLCSALLSLLPGAGAESGQGMYGRILRLSLRLHLIYKYPRKGF